MRSTNYYPGTCYQCGVYVAAHTGQRIKKYGRHGIVRNVKRLWLVRCKDCTSKPCTQ